MTFSARHLFSPLRTLFNWDAVEFQGWQGLALAWGVAGSISYALLFGAGLRASEGESQLGPLALSAAGDGDDGRSR